ncbi:MAG: M48 family metallopeptidase [Dyella sp.]|nr:M48 family metallopeptidase [Dyella sp.]
MHFKPLSLCLAATLFAGATTHAAHAVDLGAALKGGLGSAMKAATLTDDDVRQAADEGCAWMDEHNSIAKPGTPYADRLARITEGLDHEDGLNLNFKVYLVKDVNAFAMANGCVRVFAGLMDQATDDEIRGVIGHEIGHAKLGHTKAKMRAEMLTLSGRQGAAAAGGTAGAIAASQIGGLTEAVINAQFSQKEESAADEYGYHFMIRHHYDPNAMVSLFKKLGGQGGLLSSHPASPDRARKIEKLIEKGA